MKRSLVKHLVCPETQCPLALEVIEEVNGEVRTGVLKSRNGRTYPIERFVPRFVRSDEYASTFSEQRKHVRRHFSDYRRDRVDELTDDLFFRSTGFDPAGFAGLTLDAGCGYGRFLSVIERQGGEVIGVDLSAESAALAYEAAGTRPNVHVVNADLARLPFRRGYFQRIFSIGVLHHTPNPQRSFEDLVSHLSEGGEIAVWVYAPGEKSASDAWRKVTTKLPLGVVYVWCVVKRGAVCLGEIATEGRRSLRDSYPGRNAQDAILATSHG